MVTGLFITKNGEALKFWSITFHLCITLPCEPGSEWNSRLPHILSSFILPSAAVLREKHNCSSARDTTMQDNAKAAPAWLWLVGSPQSVRSRSCPWLLCLDSLQSASSSLSAFNQRRDNIFLPGRQLLLSATWLSPSYRLHYLQNRIVSENLCTTFRLRLPFATKP